MSIALLDDDIGAELEAVEALRNASRHVERGGLDWPDLRRAVLAYGGIGPSRDWERDNYPADLYRANGNAPDVVAAEAMHPAPWGDTGDDRAMFAYLQRSYAAWQRYQQSAPHRAPKPAPVAPRALKTGERSYADLVRDLRAKHGA